MVAMTEQAIKTRVIDQLNWDNRVDASNIGVTINEGCTRLTGTVPSYRAKRAAEADARGVLGTRKIDNQLQVQIPPNVDAPSDKEIALDVRKALSWNADIDSSKIAVTVTEGVVTLEGVVDGYWKKFQAEEDAYWVIGVIDIDNQIAVLPDQRLNDEIIGELIEAAINRSNKVGVDEVTVEVNDAVVTLSGVVPTWESWRAAHDAAMYTTGVVDVVDQLAIRE